MKKLLAALLFSVTSMASADMMVMKNQQGGIIALIKDTCPIEHDKNTPMYMALATAENIQVPGCWFFKDMTVHVFWFPKDQDVVQSKYPAIDFEFVPSEKQ